MWKINQDVSALPEVFVNQKSVNGHEHTVKMVPHDNHSLIIMIIITRTTIIIVNSIKLQP